MNTTPHGDRSIGIPFIDKRHAYSRKLAAAAVELPRTHLHVHNDVGVLVGL